MEFLFGVLVGGMVVGGVVLAKVMAMKAEAKAAPSRYLTGWNPQEADDTGHLSEAVTGGHGEGL